MLVSPDPHVMTTVRANYATHAGVKITCQHSCHLSTGNLQHLWTLRSIGLLRTELHDNAKKTEVEKDLNLQIHLVSGDGKCDVRNMTEFSLDIVGMSDLLQHAVVSCGVRVDQNSPQVYSNKDTYIIINETGQYNIFESFLYLY